MGNLPRIGRDEVDWHGHVCRRATERHPGRVFVGDLWQNHKQVDIAVASLVTSCERAEQHDFERVTRGDDRLDHVG